MSRLLVALALSALALVCWGAPKAYVHRIALVFEPASSQVPPNGVVALKAMFDDAKRECLEEKYIAVVVEDLAPLPLGKVSSGATRRTQQVAAAVREASGMALRPYEGSLSPDSERARHLGLKLNQVLVELSCPPRGA